MSGELATAPSPQACEVLVNWDGDDFLAVHDAVYSVIPCDIAQRSQERGRAVFFSVFLYCGGYPPRSVFQS